jgi:long-chain acyl-CoA synthetase
VVNIAELVLRHAGKGAADAIVDYDSGRRRSFADLDDRVRRLASALENEFGLSRGDRVAVLSRNSLEYMEILLACALKGFLVQAMNWRLSAVELTEILVVDVPDAVLHHDEFTDVIADVRPQVDCDRWLSWRQDGGESDLEELIARTPTALAVPPPAGGADPFLVVYTGGTTGVSKGAVHTHSSAVAAMAQNSVAERTNAEDKFLLMGQMFHSPVILAMNYLTHGCPVVMVNFKPETVLSAIAEERVTASMGIPTMFQMMIPLLDAGGWDVSSLRNVQYGGSPIAKSVVRELIDLLGCGLIQCYGRTEELAITFLSQEDHIRAVQDIHPERLESCGREAWLTSVALVDGQGNAIPRSSDAAGELVARSPAAMVGYLGRPDLTAEATYLPGWLRTGDVAQFDKDGYLYIVGRAKELIISGGENIYPAQVERAIQKHSSVEEVAVVGVPDSHWGESVKAYVVARPGRSLTEAEVIDAAVTNLGSYQKPKFVEFLNEMPKTPTGKIDKMLIKSWVHQEPDA